MLRLLDYWKAHFLSRRILGEKGAVRVHGGFAWTVVAFVLKEISPDYKNGQNIW
ncbi:MAG: hypothetical protein GX025_03345 [Clostridiales bacterium]|nr:hypothetical protein [Clostridiales bacterium]